MGLFSFLFGIKKPPFTTSANFTVLDKEYHPEIGDKVNLWPKPNSTIIHVYRPKTFGGEGLVGKFNSLKIHRYLNNQNLICEPIVFYITKSVIAIKIKVSKK